MHLKKIIGYLLLPGIAVGFITWFVDFDLGLLVILPLLGFSTGYILAIGKPIKNPIGNRYLCRNGHIELPEGDRYLIELGRLGPNESKTNNLSREWRVHEIHGTPPTTRAVTLVYNEGKPYLEEIHSIYFQ